MRGGILRGLGLTVLAGSCALGVAPKKPHRPLPAMTEGAPIEHPAALASFFTALDALGNGPTEIPATARLCVFGDSHTAADFFTGRLRNRLQARYGDAGPGLILPARPWRGYPHEGVEQDFGRRWPASSLRGAESEPKVGLAGASLEIPEDEHLGLRGAFGAFALHTFGPEGLEPRVSLSEPMAELPPALDAMPLLESFRLEVGGGLLRILQPRGPGPWRELFVSLPPGLRLLGVDLCSGLGGVLVDELGLNGAELFDLEKWDPGLRRALLTELHPALLVLAYGTNELGRKDLNGPAYRERAASLLRTLRAESGASILLVGPLDRLGRRRRGQNFKAGSRTVIAAMRGACQDAGCAFWDAKAAMGGDGAIQRWRKQRLAQRDLVHLTGPGYQKLGDLLLKALDDARKAGGG